LYFEHDLTPTVSTTRARVTVLLFAFAFIFNDEFGVLSETLTAGRLIAANVCCARMIERAAITHPLIARPPCTVALALAGSVYG
jgi:hypothetical protein